MVLPRLYRLLLTGFVGPFLASFSVAVLVLVLQFLAIYQNDIFGKGFPALLIVQLVGYASVQMMALALPIGLLVASLMTMGKLGERYELAALKSSGVSLFRIIRPLLWVAVLMAGVSLWFNWQVIPMANLKLYSLLYDVKEAKPEFVLQPGRFDKTLDGYVLYFPGYTPGGALRNIKVWEHKGPPGYAKLTYADSARMTIDQKSLYLTLKLYRGERREELPPDNTNKGQDAYAVVKFDTALYKLDMSGLGFRRSDERWFARHRYMMPLHRLAESLDSLKALLPNRMKELAAGIKGLLATLPDSLKPATGAQPVTDVWTLFDARQRRSIGLRTQQSLRRLEQHLHSSLSLNNNLNKDLRRTTYDIHAKLMLPLACVLFLLLGAPLGAIVRKGGIGFPVVVSLGFFILFYLIQTQGKKLSQKDILLPEVGAWLPLAVLLPIAFYLLHQSATDSRLFDLSAWKSLPRRVLVRFRRYKR